MQLCELPGFASLDPLLGVLAGARDPLGGMTISAASSSSIVPLTAALTAVLVAARTAFPGWSSGGLTRWIRGAVLVSASTYCVLAAAALYVAIDAERSGARLTGGEAQLAHQIFVLGLLVAAALAATQLLARLAPYQDATDLNQPGRVGLLVAGLIVTIIATSTADTMMQTALDPAIALVMWLTMTATYVGYEIYAAATTRVSERTIRQRQDGGAERLRRRYGDRLVDGQLIGTGPGGHEQRIGRVLTVIGGQGIWLVLDTASNLAPWHRDRPLGVKVSSPITKVEFRNSWLRRRLRMSFGA